MALFKKTNPKIFSKPVEKVTPDTLYWKKLGVPVLVKEFGAIDSIDFSPIEPYYCAVTCSAKVRLYNPITKQEYKTLSKFKETAYGGKFRSDGQLLCVGGEECVVKLFEAHKRSLLRVFKGHTSAVHRCYFTSDQTHITSFSDDKSVAVWDIPSEAQLHQFSCHGDYVRAGAVSPVCPTTLVSGSYDHKIRMFDWRTSTEPVLTLDHGSPVECLLFLPSGGIFISGGGTEVRVWDALAGGRLLAKITAHHKTVTCLNLASNNSRLLSGSLDRHVKIYDVSTYRQVHNLDYSSPILSLAVSAEDQTVAVGTVDGMLSLRRRELEPGPAPRKPRNNYLHWSDRPTALAAVDDVVALDKKQIHSKYDSCLRKFRYAKALAIVLRPYVVNKTPHETVSLLLELIRRQGLEKALVHSKQSELDSLLKFLIKYLGDLRFTRVLIDVANVLLDVVEPKAESLGPGTRGLLAVLLGRVREEEGLAQRLIGLGGALAMLLSAAALPSNPPNPHNHILPSQSAQQNLILTV